MLIKKIRRNILEIETLKAQLQNQLDCLQDLGIGINENGESYWLPKDP